MPHTSDLEYHLSQVALFPDEISDYMLTVMDNVGTIKKWNKGAEKLMNYLSNEIVEKNFEIFFSNADKEQGLLQTLLIIASASGKSSHDGLLVRKNGTKFHCTTVITTLYNTEGQVEGFSSITKDQTEKTAAADAELKYLNEIEKSKKEMEQLASAASHDLLVPSRTITSFLGLFQQKFKNLTDDDSKRYIEIITQSADRMKEMIKGILDYSLIGTHEESGNVDCTKLVDEVKIILQSEIKETGAIVNYGNLPLITGYKTDLRMLFRNLIHNSIKFRKPGITPIIKINATENSDGWVFRIKDNGIGIEENYRDELFTIFYRLHGTKEYPGIGIGLTIAKKIVESHGGKIWIESDTTTGSTFYFSIPAAKHQ